MTNQIAIVKTDIQMLRCAISDPFGRYKPESEHSVNIPDIREDKTLKRLVGAFQCFMLSEPEPRAEREYDQAHSIIFPLRSNYAAKDITTFSIAFAKFQNMVFFEDRAGPFISALIDNCADKEITIITEHLAQMLNYFGYYDIKHVVIKGSIGESCCPFNLGTVDIEGHVGHQCGLKNKATINIKGNTGTIFGYGNKGKLNVGGRIGSLGGDIGTGDIYESGKQIVKDGERLV